MILVFTIGGSLVVMGVAAFLFSQQGGSTRSVAHVLYDTENAAKETR